MDSLEQAFHDMEEAAASALKSTADLAKLARALQKAAQDGNINAIKRTCSRLGPALSSLSQKVANATETWSFTDEEEENYLRERYANELCHAAREKKLSIHERDGRLISYPSIAHILPVDRAVRIDKRKVSTLRPSRLVEFLIERQKKPSRFKSAAFLEALYAMYLLISKERPSTRLINDGYSPVVPLVEVYKAFTSLPGSKREYDHVDFARDVYALDASGPSRTKKGARVSFPSSTGAKRVRDTFQFVGPDEQLITYYGIQFSGGE